MNYCANVSQIHIGQYYYLNNYFNFLVCLSFCPPFPLSKRGKLASIAVGVLSIHNSQPNVMYAALVLGSAPRLLQHRVIPQPIP